MMEISDAEDYEEQTLEQRLTDEYYEPIEPQIRAMVEFQSGPLLARTVFNRMETEGVISLVTWLLSKPDKHESLATLYNDAVFYRLVSTLRHKYGSNSIFQTSNVVFIM